MAMIALAYLVAIAAACAWLILGPDTSHLWLDALIADVVGTVVIFGFSRAYRNSSVYDAYWSVAPPLLLAYWWIEAPDPAPLPSLLLFIVIAVWSVRLTVHWANTFPGLHHEDWRYPMLKERAGAAEVFVDLFAIHLFPTAQVFLAMLPAYVAVNSTEDGFAPLAWVALIVGAVAIWMETLADIQMRRFLATKSPGEVMDRGLWGWSRHPNYVGEVGVWLSVMLFGIAAAPGQLWWLPIGAIAMLAMFLGVSIPMMEDRSMARRPGYSDVIQRVSRFVPRPPKKQVDR